MKKTYINPTLKVVNVRPMQMVMTSPGVPVDPKETGDQDKAEARRARFHSWDEDME
jgi:hypothetical protein